MLALPTLSPTPLAVRNNNIRTKSFDGKFLNSVKSINLEGFGPKSKNEKTAQQNLLPNVKGAACIYLHRYILVHRFSVFHFMIKSI